MQMLIQGFPKRYLEMLDPRLGLLPQLGKYLDIVVQISIFISRYYLDNSLNTEAA